MTYELNETHRPDLASWVESANDPQSDFPIQNLPFGVFRRHGEPEARVGVAIGDQILDICAAQAAGCLTEELAQAASLCQLPFLNALLGLGPEQWSALRAQISALLRHDAERPATADILVSQADVELLLPVGIGDYTDFYASVHHATNVGSMFRPDNPLLPNYKHVPIGYHGRASSIVPSGTAVRRPAGQRKPPDADAPSFGPCRQLDYELEVGAIVGTGNELGRPIPLSEAERYLFGLCLVNDWSARDIQAWEYQPLGPFLAKSFATTISPWIVTLEALAPFRAPAFARPEGDPEPLPYLLDERNQQAGGFAITLEVLLASEKMREEGVAPQRLSVGGFEGMYWTLAQMLAHHTSNGCNMRPGDLFASGTVSGTAKESRGCLLELTWRGSEPIELPTGEQRRFLEDGDELIIRGWCEREGARRIGLGECRGVVAPHP